LPSNNDPAKRPESQPSDLFSSVETRAMLEEFRELVRAGILRVTPENEILSTQEPASDPAEAKRPPTPASREDDVAALDKQLLEWLERRRRQKAESKSPAQPAEMGSLNLRQRVIALDANNGEAHANLGVLLFFQGDYAKAAPELCEALRLKPELWKIQALLGLSERRMGQTEGARKNLEHAFPKLEEEKLRVEVGMELTEMYYASGDLEKAAGLIAALRNIRPADPDILYTAHRIYSDLAEEARLSVAMAAPDSARMHQLMANEAARRGNFDAAIEQYREATRIEPHLPAVHFHLAETLQASPSQADQSAAEREYERAFADNPLDVRSVCRLAEYALGRNDLKEAHARYAQAVALQPRDASANLGMARVLMETGQIPKALPFLLRAVETDATNPVVHMRLATVYRESGRRDDAARELAEFRKLKDLKDRLQSVYEKMRLRAPGQERQNQDIPDK
jgi:tetratricopeptide (TPR) repeat protein